jgi:hypothetical protein
VLSLFVVFELPLSKVCFILVGAMVYSGVSSIALDWLFFNDAKAERSVENL